MRLSASVFPSAALPLTADARTFVGVSLDNQFSFNPTRLRPVFDWTRQHLGRFDVLIGDYVNRHNYEALDGMTELQAVEKSVKEGHRIAEQLQRVLADDSHQGWTLLSAATLCTNSRFQDRFARLGRHRANNPLFRDLIDEAVDAFLLRRLGALPKDTRVRAHCIAYQLEELAMFEALADSGYRVFLYPGSQLPAMKSLVSRQLSGVSPALESMILVECRLFEDRIQ